MKKLKPETEEEKQLHTTPGGMRVLMMRHARESPLVRSVDTAATFFRMTDLDRYTTLAYYALRRVEELEARLLEMASSAPPRPVTVCAACAKNLTGELKEAK